MILLCKCEFNQYPVIPKSLPLIQSVLLNSRSHFQLPIGFLNLRYLQESQPQHRLNWVPFSRNLLLYSGFHPSEKAICSVESSQSILSYFSPTTHPPHTHTQKITKFYPLAVLPNHFQDKSHTSNTVNLSFYDWFWPIFLPTVPQF